MERVTEAAVRRQRTIQTTLLFIILATLPCYCVGFVLLGVAPRGGQRTPVVTATTAGMPLTPTLAFSLVPSITPFPTLGDASLSPLRPTPTQIRLFPTYTLTFTPIIPTRTPIPLPPTQTPIVIIPPTSTTIIIPTTAVPPTAVPPTTEVPSTATHTATSVPPSVIPPTTEVPPTAIPPTTAAPPTAVATTASLPTADPTKAGPATTEAPTQAATQKK
jgi:hypothetical protein